MRSVFIIVCLSTTQTALGKMQPLSKQEILDRQDKQQFLKIRKHGERKQRLKPLRERPVAFSKNMIRAFLLCGFAILFFLLGALLPVIMIRKALYLIAAGFWIASWIFTLIAKKRKAYGASWMFKFQIVLLGVILSVLLLLFLVV